MSVSTVVPFSGLKKTAPFFIRNNVLNYQTTLFRPGDPFYDYLTIDPG